MNQDQLTEIPIRKMQKINQRANSYFVVLDTPIVDPTPSESNPDGFDEQASIPQDHLSSVIAVEPLSQIAPTTSETESSTSSEDLKSSQSEFTALLELNHDPSVLK